MFQPAPGPARPWLFPLALAAYILAAVPAFAQETPAPRPGVPDSAFTNAQRVEGWRADLKALDMELPKRHINLYAKLPKEKWDQAVAQLDADIPGLSDPEVVVRLMELVNMAGDSHTGITAGPNTGFRLYPLGLYWFSDGIYVLQTLAEHKDLLGARLTAIEGLPIEEVVKRASVVIPHENESQLRAQVPLYVVIPEILYSLKLAASMNEARFSFTLPDGSPAAGTLGAITPSRELKFENAQDPAVPKPYYMHQPGKVYWTEYLPLSQMYYVAYNSCREAPDLPMAAFQQQVLDGLGGQPVSRLVIDLRVNSGGNSALLDPLIDSIAARPELGKPGKVCVLIGRRTFSSALLNALSLKEKAGAVLVGEPTGGKPSHFGEVKSFELPVSGLKVSYSTKYFERPGFTGDSLLPDIPVETTFADYLAGKDPEMEKLAALPAP